MVNPKIPVSALEITSSAGSAPYQNGPPWTTVHLGLHQQTLLPLLGRILQDMQLHLTAGLAFFANAGELPAEIGEF